LPHLVVIPEGDLLLSLLLPLPAVVAAVGPAPPLSSDP
jgi:hypothetical protein